MPVVFMPSSLIVSLAAGVGVLGAVQLGDPARTGTSGAMMAASVVLVVAGTLGVTFDVSVDGAGFIEALVISALVGYVLWLALPRGVVLTKAPPPEGGGERWYDRWTLRNESALTIRLEGVSLVDPLGEVEVGSHLTFVDHMLEVRRHEWELPWAGMKVPPGEELIAHVPPNHTMVIDYRRDGLFGRVERRSITIHGVA